MWLLLGRSMRPAPATPPLCDVPIVTLSDCVFGVDLGCGKSQSDVVRHPGSRAVEQLWFECGTDLFQILHPRDTSKAMKEVLRERLEPVDDVARQGSRSRNQRNAINPEPCTLQARGVVTRSREIPRHASVPINAAAIQSLNQCRLDLAYTAMASVFGHEAPTGFQRAVHGGDHGIGTFYPVQHRVA